MAAFSHQRAGNVPRVPFTLGKGHMLSCVRYGAYLAARHHWIVEEMAHRGFIAMHDPVMVYDFHEACIYAPDTEWLVAAIDTVRARIIERLATMKRSPRWTNSLRPFWAVSLTATPDTETK
jgi:hypothetical protein